MINEQHIALAILVMFGFHLTLFPPVLVRRPDSFDQTFILALLCSLAVIRYGRVARVSATVGGIAGAVVADGILAVRTAVVRANLFARVDLGINFRFRWWTWLPSLTTGNQKQVWITSAGEHHQTDSGHEDRQTPCHFHGLPHQPRGPGFAITVYLWVVRSCTTLDYGGMFVCLDSRFHRNDQSQTNIPPQSRSLFPLSWLLAVFSSRI